MPVFLHKQQLDYKICKLLSLEAAPADLSYWESMLERLYSPKETVRIGIVGKYMQHQDAYKCVFEALHHAAITHQVKLDIQTFESEKVSSVADIQGCDAYLVPGGFGERGWMGKILTAKLCRENKIPYFGLCLGMQVMCV